MLIGRINGATRVLGKPDCMTDDECGSLAIRDIPTDTGNVMVSAWMPTPAEALKIAAGEPVYLWIHGTGHPPVALSVGDL